MMNKSVNTLFKNAPFYGLLTILIIWHLWSLTYSPIVWFDEVFMASITNSFINGNGFALEISKGEQIFTYGPVYFILTAAASFIDGITIFSFRVVNLIFALLTIIVFYKIMTKINLSLLIKRIIVLMFLFDVIFVQNSHSGRMEFVAIFFALLCLLYYLKDYHSAVDYSLIASFASLSFLTTPRVAVILVPILLFVLLHLFNSRQWFNVFLLLSIFLFSYLAWVFVSYGSINEWYNYYAGASSNSTESNLNRFVGGSFFIPKHQYPLIIAAIFALFYKLGQKEYKVALLFSSPILLFYILVKDPSGLYSAFILTFCYTLLALGLKDFSKAKWIFKYSFYSIVVLCVFINLGIFILKGITILSTINGRDHKALNIWVKKNIKSNSIIVGSECYYYSCLSNKCSLGLLYPDCYFSKLKKPNYLLLSKRGLTDNRIVEGFATFKSNYDIVYISSYNPITMDNVMLKQFSKLGIDINSSYAGDLYKVKLKNK